MIRKFILFLSLFAPLTLAYSIKAEEAADNPNENSDKSERPNDRSVAGKVDATTTKEDLYTPPKINPINIDEATSLKLETKFKETNRKFASESKKDDGKKNLKTNPQNDSQNDPQKVENSTNQFASPPEIWKDDAE